MNHPNVLFIFPDQLGALWTSVYGHPVVQTPHLQALATRSMTWDRGYTVAPLCTPARCALMTGRYPLQTGVTRLGQALPLGEETLADHFNSAGYRTSYIGKWHLAGPPHANRQVLPHERGGWRDFIGWDSHHVNHWAGSVWDNDAPMPRALPGHETDGLTAVAQQRLRELCGGDEPFFLFFSPQSPHPPCTPPAEFLEFYSGRSDLAGRPNYDPSAHFYNHAWDCDYGAQIFLERYFGEISHLDAAVGRLLATLDECGRRNDTVVVFTSDHGEMAGCHGRFGKQVMWEEATRVPVLISHPQGPRGSVSEALFSTVDWLPTLLELCDLPASPRAAGFSHALALHNQQPSSPRTAAFMQEQDVELAIVRGDWKLVADSTAQTALALYNSRNDPFELENCVGETSIAVSLLGELQSWNATVKEL